VGFNLNNIDKTEIKQTDLKIKPYKNRKEFAKFDLTLYANEAGGKIYLNFRYSTQLFKRSTIEKLKECFVEIVGQVVDNVDIKLRDIVFSDHYLIPKPRINKNEGKDGIDDFNF
jgi:hypothetical protein